METFNSVKLSTQVENESNYINDVNIKMSLRNENDNNNIIRKDINFQNKEIENNINTNVSDYSVEDIFNLLDINMDEIEDYEDMQNKVNSVIEKYISIFEENNNLKMVDFFKEIRSSLFGEITNESENITEAQKLLLIYEDKFNAEKNRGFKSKSTDTTNNELFNNSKGAGNPINRKTITKLLTVDSRFRNNYSTTISTNYKVDLPYVINNVIEMKLSDVEFPTTYYPFTDSYENNYFWIKYTYNISEDLSINKYVYFIVDSGNYYHETLISKLSNTFVELGVPLKFDFNLDYNNPGGIGVGDGKVTLRVDNDSSLNVVNITNIELNFKGSKLTEEYPNWNISHLVSDEESIKYFYKESTIPYQQRMGWMLGYRKDYYNNNTSHITEGILDILGPKYLYLLVDDLNASSNVNFFSSSEKSLLDGTIIARISLKGYAFSIQAQGDFGIYTEPRYYYGPVNIHKLVVKVIDEYGRLIDLNGIDFSFTLNLTTIYSQT
jgi:hypothetical protein